MTRLDIVATLLTCGLVSSACKTQQASPPSPPSEPAVPTAPPAPSAPPAPPPPLPAAAGEPTEAELAADPHKHMKAHFAHALKLQDAVLAGKLDDAKAQGRWLTEHEASEVPAGWKPYIPEFRARSKAAADAKSLDEAAVAVSYIAASCGACHAANKITPHIGESPITRSAKSIKEHMVYQVQALNKMWEGLVVPSDVAWKEGASVLSKVAVSDKALAKEKKDGVESAKLLATTLRRLSVTAGKAAKDDRPQAFADLLTTCVACHGAVRK